MSYSFTDHTADVGVDATGDTLEEAVASAVLGMFAVICDPDVVERREVKAVRATGETVERLVFNLMDECIFLHSTEGWLAGRVLVKLERPDRGAEAEGGEGGEGGGDGEGDLWRATCQLEGEPIDPDRHTELTEVKAPTKHLLEVDEDPPRVHVIYDL